MANEAERINNPDSTPGAVSTGYQLQNTNMISSRVGLDNSVLEGGTGQCILRVSGPVDVNGEIYTINSEVTFTLSTAGKYYVHLAGSGANLTPTIGTGANTFDADKNARYTDTGSYRVLNWVIYYNGTTAYVHRLTNPVNADNDYGDVGTPEETWLTSNGTWVAKRSKYYTFWMTGKGGNGGDAATSFVGITNTLTSGGGGGATGIKRLFVTAGTTWTASFTTTSGGYVSFSDGTTTILVQNGYDANSATNAINNSSGTGGLAASGTDVYFQGGDGGITTATASGVLYSGEGGSSFYAGRRKGVILTAATATNGLVGRVYGGGGSGSTVSADIVSSASGGTGYQGCIRIVG